jgi:predicted nucleotidyltransferase
LIELFDTYVNWKILGYFLSHPNTQFYANEISKKLKVSPSSANNAVKYFAEKGYLKKEEKGFATLYRLNSDNSIVVSLKRAFGLEFVLSTKPEDIFLKADPGIISLALYGSYADGTFDENSDIDFLIVTQSKKELLLPAIRELEDKLEKEVSVVIFRLSEWRKLANEKDAFYKNVVVNHVLLYGSGIE